MHLTKNVVESKKVQKVGGIEKGLPMKDVYLNSMRKYLKHYAGGNERALDLAMQCIGRVFLKEESRSGTDAVGARQEDIHHIFDWLKASIINEEAWLNRLDEQGRVKKLMKFSTVEQVLQEANKAMLRASQRATKTLQEGEEEVYAELKDGYRLVKLLTPSALDRESAMMQHCIGNGAYDEVLTDSDYLLLSLRDPSNKPHVTLEMRKNLLCQMQGKQNTPPIEKYRDLMKTWLIEHKVNCNLIASLVGYIIDADGQIHDPTNLPPGLTFEGGVNLSGTGVEILPRDMTVNGALQIKEAKSLSLNENLFVKGNLHLTGSHIHDLPKGLNVGSLMITNTQIKNLPADVTIRKHLIMSNCPITALPDNLDVPGTITLFGSKVKKLPNGLKVGTDLSLSGTEVESIGENTTIWGELLLTHSKINQLPQNLTVHGTLNLAGTDIEELPKNLVVSGSLELDRSKITKLPNDLKVLGTMNLTDTSITEIPEGVYVEQFIILSGTTINHIPSSVNQDCQVLSDMHRAFLSVEEFNKRDDQFLNKKNPNVAKRAL